MRTTTIKIKRPEGHIETVDISDKWPRGINDIIFNKIKEATKAAGRGEMLSYTVKESELSAEEKAEIEAHDKKAAWFQRHGFNSNDV